MSNADLSAVLARIERLEKRDRRWKRGAAAVLVVVTTAGLMAARFLDATSALVAANRFELKDDKGNARIAMFMNDAGQPALLLYDEHGRERLTLRLLKTPEIWFFDERGKSRAAIRVVKGEPEFVTFHKTTNKPITSMRATSEGGNFGIWNAQNQLCLATSETGTAIAHVLNLVDENGKIHAQLAKSPTSNTFFKLLDDNGNQRVVLFVGERGEGASACTFFDENGQQQLLQIGGINGKTGFVTGFNPNNNAQAFFLNSDTAGAKEFKRIQ